METTFHIFTFILSIIALCCTIIFIITCLIGLIQILVEILRNGYNSERKEIVIPKIKKTSDFANKVWWVGTTSLIALLGVTFIGYVIYPNVTFGALSLFEK